MICRLFDFSRILQPKTCKAKTTLKLSGGHFVGKSFFSVTRERKIKKSLKLNKSSGSKVERIKIEPYFYFSTRFSCTFHTAINFLFGTLYVFQLSRMRTWINVELNFVFILVYKFIIFNRFHLFYIYT